MKNYKAKKHKTLPRKNNPRLAVWQVEFERILTITLPPLLKPFKATSKEEAKEKASKYINDEVKREAERKTPVVNNPKLRYGKQMNWLWSCGRFSNKGSIQKAKYIGRIKKTDNYARSEYGYIRVVE